MELNEVLRRPRFDRYLREEERLEFQASVVRESDLVEVTSVVSVCRDPKGDEFLELTLSGDYDLLSLHPFRGIAILSPQDFVTERESPV